MLMNLGQRHKPPTVGLKIKLTPGVSCAERDVFDPLSFFEDVRKTEQDTECMNSDVDLISETLNFPRGRKDFLIGTGFEKRFRATDRS